MHIRNAAAVGVMVLAAWGASPAMAAGCSESFNLGSMGPPGGTFIHNEFWSAQQFSDCYNFQLNNSADAFGLTLEWDWSASNNIDVQSISLSGTGLSSPVVDASAETFSFSNLLSGSYQLIVSGVVSGADYARFASGPVGYLGLMSTTRSSIAAPVPEPEAYTMFALGLALVGWAARRRRSAR